MPELKKSIAAIKANCLVKKLAGSQRPGESNAFEKAIFHFVIDNSATNPYSYVYVH